MMSPKRSLSPDTDDSRETKRARTSSSDNVDRVATHSGPSSANDQVQPHEGNENVSFISTALSLHSQSRQSIQRSIAMVLRHDGFYSATPEALESFTQLVETYLESFMDCAKSMALSSRREYLIPLDFERTLKRHNISMSSLKPHILHPIPRDQTVPPYGELAVPKDDTFNPLPLLGQELSGQFEKEEKPYIPKTFPDFPSKHTYKFTPQDDVNVRDSKKIREQAARTAQQGEDALRRLVRASKMRKQKEVKSLVEKDGQGKERFRLWELTMKRFMGVAGRGEQTDQVEIADHSMIVNSDAVFARKEVSRTGKRGAPLSRGGAVY